MWGLLDLSSSPRPSMGDAKSAAGERRPPWPKKAFALGLVIGFLIAGGIAVAVLALNDRRAEAAISAGPPSFPPMSPPPSPPKSPPLPPTSPPPLLSNPAEMFVNATAAVTNVSGMSDLVSDMIVLDVDLEFTSTSMLEEKVTALRADLWYTPNIVSRSTADLEASEHIGWCSVVDLWVRRGVVAAKAQIMLQNSEAGGHALGRWLSQRELAVVATGLGLITLETSRVKILSSGLVSGETIAIGYETVEVTNTSVPFVNTSAKCPTGRSRSNCSRGFIVSGANPFGREWAVKEIALDAYFDWTFAYNTSVILGPTLSGPSDPFTDFVPVPLTDVKCDRTDTYARMVAAGTTTIPQGEGTDFSVFLTATPLPGRAAAVNRGRYYQPCIVNYPYDCCLMTALTAAACKVEGGGGDEAKIGIVLKGEATMLVDGVEMTVFPEVGLELSYTDDVLQFDLLGGFSDLLTAGFACEDVTFAGP